MFKQKTVADVLAPLNKAIAGLEEVSRKRFQSAGLKEEEADLLKSEADLDRKEAAHAEVVLEKLRKLVNEE